MDSSVVTSLKSDHLAIKKWSEMYDFEMLPLLHALLPGEGGGGGGG